METTSKWTEQTARLAIIRNGGVINSAKTVQVGKRPFSNRSCGALSYLINHCGYRLGGRVQA